MPDWCPSWLQGTLWTTLHWGCQGKKYQSEWDTVYLMCSCFDWVCMLILQVLVAHPADAEDVLTRLLTEKCYCLKQATTQALSPAAPDIQDYSEIQTVCCPCLNPFPDSQLLPVKQSRKVSA